MLFEKFGEFDSAEEINRAAQAQKDEGDEEAVFAIAKENGLDKEDAEDFLDDVIEELTTPLLAALGKIELEKKEFKIKGVLSDWTDELIEMIGEREDLQKAVRRKGKSLSGYIAMTAEYGLENAVTVDQRIVDQTKKVKKIVGTHKFQIGIPNKMQRQSLIRKYYLEG